MDPFRVYLALCICGTRFAGAEEKSDAAGRRLPTVAMRGNMLEKRRETPPRRPFAVRLDRFSGE
jgi:hypothetical protein